MPTKKTAPSKSAKPTDKNASREATKIGAPKRSKPADPVAAQRAAIDELAGQIPFNDNKSNEYGEDSADPEQGESVEVKDRAATASTLSEGNRSTEALDRVRVDSAKQPLTTNQGVKVGDNQSSLKAGFRGPALLEDFILREKLTHFDHERIPERVVHARGSAAHGYFECYKPLTKLTMAAPFAAAGKRTPVFVRFSTVFGERGSADTVRDARGFAVKFYTDDGNWDLVGNNIPVFFIQDAMKFPDLVHAAKPEQNNAMPQAATAHDTFWDFVSLMPEATHMLMWAMSDRALPRSYRMMQGFGIHTFRLINEEGDARFVKFHWTPVAGTHSLDWDEAVKLCGADADFHRRDLWEAIEAGAYPEWELGIQVFTEEQAEEFSFDILDATKLIPEELVPVVPVGKMVLDRNPDNFFAETEQVAFCTAHIIPGLDFSSDPLLAGRIHSYVDTQISRLGGPNFHEIPINAPIAPVHNNQRDGMHRQAIPRGKVAYEPNSLGGGCPFQAGAKGFRSFPEPTVADKVRGKPVRFAEHYAQATLFWNSQSPVEKMHIRRAFRFELSKLQVPAIRERMLAGLVNVAFELAEGLAEDLGMALPEPLPKMEADFKAPEVDVSPALSLLSRPGDGSIKTRKVAVLVANGVKADGVKAALAELTKRGAVPKVIAARLGSVEAEGGETVEIDATFENSPSVLFDGVIIPDGHTSAQNLSLIGQAGEFLHDQYRHCKPILSIGAAKELLESIGIPATLPSGDEDPGLIQADDRGAGLGKFVGALAKHRAFARAEDPPSL